jgi:hypothetical protein
MTTRGHEFGYPPCRDGKFRCVMIAAPDGLLIELVEWRELEQPRMPPR